MATPRPRSRGALPSVALVVGVVGLALAGSSGARLSVVDPYGGPPELGQASVSTQRGCELTPATKPRWDKSVEMNRIGSELGLRICGTAERDLITAVGGNEIWARQGDDEIRAANGVKDPWIDPGGGYDTVYADRCDVVAMKFAEKTRRARRSSCREVRRGDH